jgi:hypothetical protein
MSFGWQQVLDHMLEQQRKSALLVQIAFSLCVSLS